MDIAVLGIDLGKTVCSLSGLDRSGAVVFRKLIQTTSGMCERNAESGRR